MRERVQLRHVSANGIGVKGFEITGPIVLIAQAPENHRRMIVMLVNHVPQHVAALLLVALAAKTTAAPWDFLPHEQPELITHLQHER